MKTEVIACPVCGAPMNHHANKLAYRDEEAGNVGMTDILEEFHRCPRCGAGVERATTFDGRS